MHTPTKTVQASFGEPSDVSIEYLAGYFDGEGCFHSRMNRKTVGFGMNISTTKESEAMIFKEKFSGCVKKHKTKNENHSDFWSWQVSGSKARMAAEKLYPYLRGKQDQCEIFLEALEFKQSCPGGSYGGDPYTDENRNVLKEYGEKITEFNASR